MSRKILYSPGFGAGWVSWEGNPEIQKFMLTYQPIIDFLEGGGNFKLAETDNANAEEKLHPILAQFARECQEKFGSVPYLGGARDLMVATVDGDIKIDEYDGSESIVYRYDTEGWM